MCKDAIDRQIQRHSCYSLANYTIESEMRLLTEPQHLNSIALDESLMCFRLIFYLNTGCYVLCIGVHRFYFKKNMLTLVRFEASANRKWGQIQHPSSNKQNKTTIFLLRTTHTIFSV